MHSRAPSGGPKTVDSASPQTAGSLAVLSLRPQGLTGRATSATLFAAVCVVAIPLLLAVGVRTGWVIVIALPVLPAAWLLPGRLLAAVVVTGPVVVSAAAAAGQADTNDALQSAVAFPLLALVVRVAATSVAAAGQRARRADLAARVARIATSATALPTILERILAELSREGLRGGSVALIDDQDCLYVAAYHGTVDESVLAARLPVGQGIMGRVAASGEPVIVDDLDAPGTGAANRRLGTNAQIRSMVAVPIVAEGRVAGVLEIDSARRARFDPDDLVTLVNIAAAISAAIQQTTPLRRANDQLRLRLHELSVLQETARTLAASLEFDEVLRNVARLTAQGLRAEHATLLRLDGEQLTPLVEDSAGESRLLEPSAGAEPAEELTQMAVAAVRSGVLSRTGARLHTAGAYTHGAFARIAAAGAFTGLLVAGRNAGGGFDDAEVRLLAGIADLASLSLGTALTHRRISHMADTDALTALPNRRAFERFLAVAQRRRFAVLAIDVDDLKRINDHHGHEAGDAALCAVAEMLRGGLRGDDVVARTGGDEFCALLPSADAEEAAAAAERMRRACDALSLPYGEVHISIGYAVGRAREHGRDLWAAADDALLRAKRAGRNRAERALPAGGEQASRLRRRWEAAVAAVLEAGRVSVLFQPISRLDTAERGSGVVGYDSVARPPRRLSQGVDELFDAARRMGAIRDLDWLCRRAALEEARRLPADRLIFVHASVAHLLHPLHDADQMELLSDWVGRPPSEVVLEIDEADLAEDPARLARVLGAYRAGGFRLAVDNGGEHPAALELLGVVEPDFIKTAPSLTRAAPGGSGAAIVAAIVETAHINGATVVAKGLESRADVRLMAARGIELGQGWWIGPPVRWRRPRQRPAARATGARRTGRASTAAPRTGGRVAA